MPYLVKLYNYGASRHPGEAGQGGDWVWGYDEVSWFANQNKAYRAQWLRYAWNWLKKTDPNGYLEMPGSRTETSPLNHGRLVFSEQAECGRPGRPRRRRGNPRHLEKRSAAPLYFVSTSEAQHQDAR